MSFEGKNSEGQLVPFIILYWFCIHLVWNHYNLLFLHNFSYSEAKNCDHNKNEMPPFVLKSWNDIFTYLKITLKTTLHLVTTTMQMIESDISIDMLCAKRDHLLETWNDIDNFENHPDY